MLDKLEAIERRFVEIEAQLSDPASISDRSLLTCLAKERSDIKEVVMAFRRWRSARAELKEGRSLLGDPDSGIREMARGEVPQIERRIEEIEAELKRLLVPKDPLDVKNAIVEIRSGTGGDEAALFAAEIMRLYMRFADTKGWVVEVMNLSETESGGIKEAILGISGKDAYGWLKYESGVHRVQRVPVTESQGRIHTSAATVAVLPEAAEIDLVIDEKDLRIDVMRSGGAGGQHVNKTESAVRLTHIPTGIAVHCQDERSQHKNRAKAMKVLRSRLLELERRKRDEAVAANRRSMVGTGDRSEKIRTYNFPQDRITDHRIGLTRHNIQGFMAGDVEEFFTEIRAHFQAEALKNISA